MKTFNLAAHANKIRGNDGTGRFVTQQLDEPRLLGESPQAMPSDEVWQNATQQLGDRVRAEAAANIRDWKGNHWMHSTIGFGPKPPQPLREMAEDARVFEHLARKQQAELVGPELARLVEGDYRFGNEHVQVAAGFEPEPASVLIGLSAQLRMKDAEIPGEITFTSLKGGEARFEIADQGLVHNVGFSQDTSMFSRDTSSDPGSAGTGWLSRANTGVKVSGSSRTDNFTERPGHFRRDYIAHHEQAMLFDTLGTSPFREEGRHFTSVRLSDRSAKVRCATGEYYVHLDGGKPVVLNDQGAPIRDEEAGKVLDRLALTTGQQSGEEFCRSLSQVFDETERRLKR